jgi:hypothetical protein
LNLTLGIGQVGKFTHLKCISLKYFENFVLSDRRFSSSYHFMEMKSKQRMFSIIRVAVKNEIERLCSYLNIHVPDSDTIQPWQTLRSEKLKGNDEFRLYF